jgi:hypothetical protein
MCAGAGCWVLRGGCREERVLGGGAACTGPGEKRVLGNVHRPGERRSRGKDEILCVILGGIARGLRGEGGERPPADSRTLPEWAARSAVRHRRSAPGRQGGAAQAPGERHDRRWGRRRSRRRCRAWGRRRMELAGVGGGKGRSRGPKSEYGGILDPKATFLQSHV